MAEFLVGLVSIMLLIVGLQQIAFLSEKSFEAHTNVRSSLAEQLADPMSDYIEGFVFATKTDPGPDEKNYTADDQIVVGDDAFYEEGRGFLHAVDYAVLNGFLYDYEREDPYYNLSDSSFTDISKNFQMFYAADQQPVDVVPFLRKILGKDIINVQRELWMPAWDGLME
jgi:hypothetical protein